VDRFQYLLVLVACLVVTLPLEVVVGVRVWRQPRRLLATLVAPVVLFSAWDLAAIAAGQWRFNRRYITRIDLPGHLPIEELAFFVVVPICALLTFEAVKRIRTRTPSACRPDRTRGTARRA
jgi:lycopene beta-cyclase